MATREQTLTQECRLLHRYLIGGAPSAYAVEKYLAAHDHLPLNHAQGWFDAFLYRVAQLHPWLMHAVQAYARIFKPFALIRKKAVLLFAIIECCAPALTCIQADHNRTPSKTVIASSLVVVGFAAELLVAFVVFAPVQLVNAILVTARGRVAKRRPPIREAV